MKKKTEIIKRVNITRPNFALDLPEPIEVDLEEFEKWKNKDCGREYIVMLIIEKWKETYKRLSKYEKED